MKTLLAPSRAVEADRLIAPGPSRAREREPFVIPISRAEAPRATPRHILNATVVVAALGYFVDIYDLILFSIVRVPSLTSLNVPQAQMLDVGVLLINMQMAGMLVGGIAWGVLGDKRGRISVLFGSILLYSLANIANAFVTDVTTYAALRFVAGVGLAGELGAAVTLVSEVMPKETRGYGTAIVAGVGIMGAVVGALVGGLFSWQVAYIVGGVMGLALLALRWKLTDSRMFAKVAAGSARRGDLRLLFGTRERTLRFARCVLVGIPAWFVIGILITFSPELARELGVAGVVSAGTAIAFCYGGLAIGDVASGFISQRIGSRKKVLAAFLAATAALTVGYALVPRGLVVPAFYALSFVLGLAAGYWAVFVTNAAEQFGTNLRSTVATMTPNLVRGAVVPMALAFQAMRSLGLLRSALIVGAVAFALAFLALWGMDETSKRDLDFIES